MSHPVPKAVLYYYPESVWSSAVLLALEEKGYADEEVDRKIVDLAKGENFSVTYLRLSLNSGTVPTLVVPFRDSLSDDVESRYKALTDPKAIISFIDKSRSPLSRTRTTSTAPAPALAPATVAFTAASNALLDILHAEDVSPDALMAANARDSAALKALAMNMIPLLVGKQNALAECLSDTEAGKVQASEKVKKFWRDKQNETEQLLAVLQAANTDEAELDAADKTKREEFFARAKTTWEVKLAETLVKLNKEIIGPYTLGDQLSICDISLAAWLRSVVGLAGGSARDDSSTAIGKLEAHVGSGFALSKEYQVVDVRREESAAVSKLAAFWEAMSGRESWKKVYAA